MHQGEEEFFESIKSLPSREINIRSAGLVGFEERYAQISRSLRLVLDLQAVEDWSRRHHGDVLPVVSVLADRHPLVVLEGDVGTGKTVTAEGIASRMTTDMRKDGFLLKLSTRVRGKGLHGQMSRCIHAGFQRLVAEAGKKRLAFLLIDEADAIASTRDTEQMHQEEKAAVNTLIQRLDDLRTVGGRAVVFLTTNRIGVLDQALVRRASLRIRFERPSDGERRDVLARDLDGLQLSDDEIEHLVRLTGADTNDGVAFTYSDLRLRLIPEAVAHAFPDRALTFDDLREAASNLTPAPVIS